MKIFILNEIGDYGFWPADMQSRLDAANGKPVEVVINSPGGFVSDGIAIYNMLKDYSGEVTTRIAGVAASIASVIFMAGDNRIIETGGHLMIHKPALGLFGEAEELRNAADTLDTLETAIIDIYKTGSTLDRADIVAMMEKESWFLGPEALNHGFATEIKEPEFAAVANIAPRRLPFQNVPTALQTENRETGQPPETPAPQPKENENKKESSKMEIDKAKAADVRTENPEAYNEIRKAERARIQGIEALAENVAGFPEAVQKAVKTEIDTLKQDPNATAENSAAKVLSVAGKVQATIAQNVGSGPRQLGNDLDHIQPEGTPPVDSGAGDDGDKEAQRQSRVKNMTAGFKTRK